MARFTKIETKNKNKNMYIHENRLVFLDRPSNAPSAKTEKAPEKKDTAKRDAADKNANVLVDTKTVKVNPAEIAKKNGYDEVGEFNDGAAIARKDDLYFLVNEEGKVISGDYFGITEFSDGMAWASGEDDGQLILINNKGKEVNNKMYKDAHSFNEGKAGVKEGKWHFIDKEGKDLKIGEFDEVYDFNQGVAGVRNGPYWKFIKADGSKLNNKTYSSVEDFDGGFAHAKRGGIWYVVDLKGNEEVAPKESVQE